MSWLKIDDGLFLHPKWLRTPPIARALWITALSYCGKMMTDGHVDKALLTLLGGTAEDADALVASGLWDATESGYCFHDFDAYNRTTEKADAISEVRAEAGKAGAQARWGKQGNSNTPAEDSKPIAKNGKRMANGWQKMPPEPVPVSRNTNSADEDCQELVTKLYCAYRQGLHKDRSLVEPISNDAPWAEVKPHLAALDQLLAIGATPDQVLRATAKLRAEYEPKGLPTTLNGLISAWARVNVPSPVPLSFKTPEPQLAPEIEISEEEAQRRIAEILAGPKTPKPVWEPLA